MTRDFIISILLSIAILTLIIISIIVNPIKRTKKNNIQTYSIIQVDNNGIIYDINKSDIQHNYKLKIKYCGHKTIYEYLDENHTLIYKKDTN